MRRTNVYESSYRRMIPFVLEIQLLMNSFLPRSRRWHTETSGFLAFRSFQVEGSNTTVVLLDY